MAFCASNYGDKTTWGKRGDGKTWAERVADRCVRARMREVSALDEQFFAGVTPAPVAARVAALGGIRGAVLGGFNEHSAEVHCFVERAAAAEILRQIRDNSRLCRQESQDRQRRQSRPH